MHAPLHAKQIADKVAKFKRGVFEDEIRFHECGSCHRPLIPSGKLCSACKVIRYCDSTCQQRDWREHKNPCKLFQALPDTEPQMRAIAQQFPWARLQADGAFSFEVLRASRGLLGTGPEFGWWTEAPCCLPKDNYLPGSALLSRQSHLTERAGWMSDKETPWLDFSFGGKPPKLPSFDDNWASYYKWRGLPIDSPAVLLLHWPLTVFRLLTIAGVASTHASETRRQLTVHMVGIERELDFLPVFGELALLFPNTDLDLVLFGHGVSNLLKKARDPLCLASQPAVYAYTAPKVSGGGSIRILLSRAGSSFWDVSTLTQEGLRRPDALVACNAGLSTYPTEWMPVVLAARAFRIPFAVTDYNAISLQTDIKLFSTLPLFLDLLPGRLTTVERNRVLAAPSDRYEIRVNPFMAPGPRPPTFGGISALNAYEMVVSK